MKNLVPKIFTINMRQQSANSLFWAHLTTKFSEFFHDNSSDRPSVDHAVPQITFNHRRRSGDLSINTPIIWSQQVTLCGLAEFKKYQIFLTYTYQLCLALHFSFHVCSAQSSDVVPFAFNHCLSMAKAVSELWRYHVAVLKPDRSEDVEPTGAVSLAPVRKPEKEPKKLTGRC